MTAPPEDTLSARRGRAEAETSPAERVIFFSDAVVAIAITLLAIDLPVPQITNSTANGQLLRELGSDWPAFLAFIVSFCVIGSLAFGVRFTIYALIQVIAVLCQLRASLELRRAGLLRPDAPKAGTRRGLMVDVVFIAAFLLSIPVSFETRWAFALWAAGPAGARVLRAVRAPQAASST